MTDIYVLKQRLAQSEQYRRMIAEQHADALHNMSLYRRKFEEALGDESRLQHQLGMLEVEARRFREQIAELETEENSE
jgi:hypothetical protein